MTAKLAASALLFAAAASVAYAEDGKLVGTWKLVSFENEFQDSGERKPIFGANAKGFVIFTADGRVMTLLTAEGRKGAQTDEERAALMRSMFAYTGRYRLEAEGKLVSTIDASWNEAWNGTEQVRYYKVDGDRAEIVTAWAKSAVIPGQPTVRALSVWQREGK